MSGKPTDPAPYYRLHVFCCTNRRVDGHPRGSCAARGSEPLRDYLKQRAREAGIEDVRINSAGCLDRCELGPTMVIYPDGVWYHYETRGDVDEILEAHIKNGRRVKRLMLRPEDGPKKEVKIA
jgi:(2Fe-2S) ferredoxin